MTWRRAGRMRAPAVETPARDAGAAAARHLAAIREELMELSDTVAAELGDRGRPARAELLHAAGRVEGAIAEIHRGAGR